MLHSKLLKVNVIHFVAAAALVVTMYNMYVVAESIIGGRKYMEDYTVLKKESIGHEKSLNVKGASL